MRLLLATVISVLIFSSAATAGQVPQPMQNALDTYAAGYATEQGWQYADRLATMHGDYRRAYATLVFTTTYQGIDDGKAIEVPGEWEVDARVVRCGPGWYVVSTPVDRNACRRVFRLPAW